MPLLISLSSPRFLFSVTCQHFSGISRSSSLLKENLIGSTQSQFFHNLILYNIFNMTKPSWQKTITISHIC